jgi:hypothetical protein
MLEFINWRLEEKAHITVLTIREIEYENHGGHQTKTRYQRRL